MKNNVVTNMKPSPEVSQSVTIDQDNFEETKSLIDRIGKPKLSERESLSKSKKNDSKKGTEIIMTFNDKEETLPNHEGSPLSLAQQKLIYD